MQTATELPALRADLRYSVGGRAIAAELRRCGVDTATTVPDFVQLSLDACLREPGSGIALTTCANENQAVCAAAGLYFGGRRPAVIMQNQGLHNCLNSLRTVGLDGRVPLLLLVGQFGREFANLGQDPRRSDRRMVRLVEPVLDAMEIPSFRLEGPADFGNIGRAWDTAWQESRATVLIVGHYTLWD